VVNNIKKPKFLPRIITLFTIVLLLTTTTNAITIEMLTINTDQIKIGEVIVDEKKVECTGEGIALYSTNISITMPNSVYIPGLGEFELPDWLADKDIEITDVTWKEKIVRVNSSYELFIDYEADAPKMLIFDLAIILIYDLNLNLSFNDLIEIINGNYSFLIDLLKTPTLSKYTLNKIDGRWDKFIDMSNKKLFTDTYVIIGFYIDMEEQKIYRDAEIITYQSIYKKSRDRNFKQNNFFIDNFQLFFNKLLSRIISAVQRATLPETSGHLST
jgi:hypothetical protein